MLVALAIFALLSAAGVALLRGSAFTQEAVRGHLGRLDDLQLVTGTLDADLAQAAVRIARTTSGTLAPAFFAEGGGHDRPLMQFVRGGWSNPEMAPRPTVQKVEYWWRGGRLERVGYGQLDGAAPLSPEPLLDHVTAVQMRFRNREGEWLRYWRPQRADLMPTLVEMTLRLRGGAPVTLRFIVGNGRG